MKHLWLALIGFLLLSGVCAAQPNDLDALRPPGSRHPLTRAERKLYALGPVRQPEIGRPRGLDTATPQEASELLATIRAARPGTSLESMLPGLEGWRAVEARVRLLAGKDGVRVTGLGEVAGLSVSRVDLVGPPSPPPARAC